MITTLTAELSANPQGQTVEELAKDTGQTVAAVKKVLKEAPYLAVQGDKYFHPDVTPCHKTQRSMGADCHVLNPITIMPGDVARVVSNLKVPEKMPDNSVIIIASRSSTYAKFGLSLTNGIGIIDADYPDHVMFEYENKTNRVVTLTHGMSIGQAMCIHAYQIWPVCNDTRTGGFGSTDK